MQKDTMFPPTSFVPKLYYPKKCVNYKKSEFSTNSVKGPKDQNSDKKCQEVTLNSTICQEMPLKTKKLRHYSLSWQNSKIFCKDFTRDRIFFTPTSLARWYVFASLNVWCSLVQYSSVKLRVVRYSAVNCVVLQKNARHYIELHVRVPFSHKTRRGRPCW